MRKIDFSLVFAAKRFSCLCPLDKCICNSIKMTFLAGSAVHTQFNSRLCHYVVHWHSSEFRKLCTQKSFRCTKLNLSDKLAHSNYSRHKCIFWLRVHIVFVFGVSLIILRSLKILNLLLNFSFFATFAIQCQLTIA